MRAATFTVFAVLLVLLAAAPPETATLGECGEKQAAVTFPHQAHIDHGTPCVTCHHTDEGLTAESEGDVQKCTACHLNPTDEATPSCGEMSLKKNPYHAACMGCHKEEGKGPTKCTECHPKG